MVRGPQIYPPGYKEGAPMGKFKNAWLLILVAHACDVEKKRPPPIDVVPPTPGTSSSGSDGGDESGTDAGTGGSSSTGEPVPTCAGYMACAEGCLQLDASWAFGEEARQECVDSCESPPAFDLAERWGEACAKQDLETCVDCGETCENGLAVCLYFEENEQ